MVPSGSRSGDFFLSSCQSPRFSIRFLSLESEVKCVIWFRFGRWQWSVAIPLKHNKLRASVKNRRQRALGGLPGLSSCPAWMVASAVLTVGFQAALCLFSFLIVSVLRCIIQPIFVERLLCARHMMPWIISPQFSSVQWLSRVRLFATP